MPDAPLLSEPEIAAALGSVPDWRRDGATLVRTVECPTFRAAIALVGRVADAAEEADHHPDITINWRRRDLLAQHQGVARAHRQGLLDGRHHRPACRGWGRMKVGLMLPMGEQEKSHRTLPWEELRDLALAAEESGLDSVWGADHLIFRDEGASSGIHECWTILTAVAAITRRVEIGPMVLALPFRNPALTAKMATALDEVSGGRLVLGVGLRLARARVRRLRLSVRPPGRPLRGGAGRAAAPPP